MLVSAAVGFGIGVLLTLAFAPLAIDHTSHKKHPIRTGTPVTLNRSALEQRVRSLVDSALGLSPLSGRHRLISVTVFPATPAHPTPGGLPVQYDATMTFNLNPNPFSQFDTKSARSDAFQVLKTLYGHGLPFASVRLTGKFQFPDSRHPTVVMRAGSDPNVEANYAPWQKLPRSAEPHVWASLQPHWISPRFAAYRSGKT